MGPRIRISEQNDVLPGIPCLPIGADEAQTILDALAAGENVHCTLELDIPRLLRPIVNVIGRLAGSGDTWVLAGNHRDAWVRGAHDAGSGTIGLLRAAEQLGQRAKAGWQPRSTLVLGFWDAEEFGLIGSTEWAEAHAKELSARAVTYINADALVGGPKLSIGGSPGWIPLLRDVLGAIEFDPADNSSGANTLWDRWSAGKGESPRLGLPGSGSDYTVFLHHLGIPILNISFGGASHGLYHTRYDDLELMERFVDPGWAIHELAGKLLAELIATSADRGRQALDEAGASRELAQRVREAGWLGEDQAAMATAFEELATALEAEARPAGWTSLYADFLGSGLKNRPWYKNVLWAPGLTTGYASEFLPTLRRAQEKGGDELGFDAYEFTERVKGITARLAADSANGESGAR